MSPEAQRIAIAEASDWKPNPFIRDMSGQVFPQSSSDYLNDLNAMHEAEKVLLTKDGFCGCWETYSNILTASMGCTDIFHATAKQRAKAFLRTIGKWEETSK